MSSTLDDAVRLRAIESARSRWPFLRRPRRADVYPDRLLLAPPELTEYLFKDHASFQTALEQSQLIASELPGWSQEFPLAIFAYIEADCFGGSCGYGGFACRGNSSVERIHSDRRGHIRLLRHVGIVTDDRSEPFERVFFEGRCSGLPS